MIKKVFIGVSSLALLTSCSSVAAEDTKEQRFDNSHVTIMTDKETECKYIVLNDNGIAITPLLTEDGKPDCSWY